MSANLQKRVSEIVLIPKTGVPLWLFYTLAVIVLTIIEIVVGDGMPMILTIALLTSIVWLLAGASYGWLPGIAGRP